MSGVLFYLPVARQLSIAGQILPGWTATFYRTGTTTPADVYADGDLETPHENPVEADADGHMPPIYLDPGVVYRVQIRDANGVLQPDGDVDPYDVSRGSGGGGGGGGVDSLSELEDVALDESLAAGQALAYDGTKWVNSAPNPGFLYAFGQINADGSVDGESVGIDSAEWSGAMCTVTFSEGTFPPGGAPPFVVANPFFTSSAFCWQLNVVTQDGNPSGPWKAQLEFRDLSLSSAPTSFHLIAIRRP